MQQDKSEFSERRDNEQAQPGAASDISSALADAVAPKGVTPFASLHPTLQMIREGRWEEFETRSMKQKLFALQAVLLDHYWREDVEPWQAKANDVFGLGFPLSKNTVTARPLSRSEWDYVRSQPTREQRYNVAFVCHEAALVHCLDQFHRRVRNPDSDVLEGGRQIYTELLRQLQQETPVGRRAGQQYIDLAREEGMLFTMLKSGLVNGITTVWLIDSSIVAWVCREVARSHSLAFPLFRNAINGEALVGGERIHSEEQLLDAIRRTASNPKVTREIDSKLVAERSVGNTSYDSETTGCPALYTPAFAGLIQAVRVIKAALE